MSDILGGYSDLNSNSAQRWIVAVIVAAVLIFLMMLISLNRDLKPEIVLPPLMELNYVELEKNETIKPEQPKPVQRAIVKTVLEEKPVQAPPPEPVPQEAPIESTSEPIAEPDVAVAPAEPVKKETVAGTAGQPVRIGSAMELDNTNYDPIFEFKPAYPRIAMEAGIEGFVDADLVINEDGKVESFSISNISGHPSFGTETGKVLSKWRFPPPRIKGERTRIKYLYRINFVIE